MTARQARNEYRNKHCQLCHWLKATDCHEIARGPARKAALECRSTWLALCRPCHEKLGDYSEWPVERQLALKLVVDPEHFDLVKVNRIRGRADGAITLADIVPHLKVRGQL